MRLRLSIQRHRLPPTNILWNVTSTSPAYTVARLLEDVNAIVPLEAEDWGFEDYVVEIGGFECLHFSEVAQALKDEDHVTIRPLATAEVRARTLGGRDQISGDGRHLVDGVPFGRPLLRTPVRPPIRIPPRKRQRMLENEEEEEEDFEETTKPTLLLHAPIAIDTQGVVLSAEGSEARKRQASGGAAEPPRKKTKTGAKSVSFQALAEEELDSEDEDDDEDFAPEEEDDEEEDDDKDFAPGTEKREADEEKSSNSESESSSDDEADSSSDSSSASDSDSDSSDTSSSDSESDSSSASDAVSEENAVAKTTAPGAGMSHTKIRNKRRAQTKKLNHLKSTGVLPPDANLAMYREWLQMTPREREALEEKAKGTAQEPADDAAMEDAGEAAEIASAPAASAPKKRRADGGSSKGIQQDEQTALEQQRQRLLRQLEQDTTAEDDEPPTQESSRKRLKPDIPAINRMLSPLARQFSKQEAAKKCPKPAQPVFEESPAPADPDFWKSRIKLSAYECWHEGYTLGPPPFPFQQHWDPASQAMRKKAQKNKKRSNQNRQSTNGGDSSMVIMENPDTNPEPKLNLDYGDTDTFNPDASEAIESQLRQDVETATAALAPLMQGGGKGNERDLLELPPLPENISTLPDLKTSDIKNGAIIAFKQFTLNPRNMNPELSDYKTAVVMNEGDSGNGAGLIGIELASRDVAQRERKEKKYDRYGNRIFEDPAEMFQMSEDEDEEDNGGMLVQFYELLEAKLLVPAQA